MQNTPRFKIGCNGGTTYISQLKTAKVKSCLLIIFTAHQHSIYIRCFIIVTWLLIFNFSVNLYSALWYSAYNVLGAPTTVEKALYSSWQC